MGLAGGLGLYFNFQIVDALVPAVLALLLVDPALPFRRAAWLGLGAFGLGSLPFWAYNLSHDWATFATGARFQGRLSGPETARILFLDLLPVVLGARAATDQPAHLPGPLAWTIPLIAGGAVALLLVRVVTGARAPPPGLGASGRGPAPGRDRRDVRRHLVRRLRPGPALPPAADPSARARAGPRRPAHLALDTRRHGPLGGGVPRRRRRGPGPRHHGAPSRGPRPVPGAAGGRRRAVRVPRHDGPPPRLCVRLLAGSSAHLRCPGRDHRGPAVQRPLSAPHAGRGPVAAAGVRRPGGRRDVPPLAGRARGHGPRARGRRVSSLLRLHAAAGRRPAGPIGLDRPRERGARGGRQRGRRPPRDRLVERQGTGGIGVGRGGSRRRAPAERRHARQRPRRAGAGSPRRDGGGRAGRLRTASPCSRPRASRPAGTPAPPGSRRAAR